MPRTMHFAQYLMHSPTYHSIAMWRHPRTDRTLDWRRPELYQHIARVCERGKLDTRRTSSRPGATGSC